MKYLTIGNHAVCFDTDHQVVALFQIGIKLICNGCREVMMGLTLPILSI
jgi:hypothetical protein